MEVLCKICLLDLLWEVEDNGKKGFLAKCSKKYITKDMYMILDHRHEHRATVDEFDKTIKIYWGYGYKYHSQLIKDLYLDYQEK